MEIISILTLLLDMQYQKLLNIQLVLEQEHLPHHAAPTIDDLIIHQLGNTHIQSQVAYRT